MLEKDGEFSFFANNISEELDFWREAMGNWLAIVADVAEVFKGE